MVRTKLNDEERHLMMEETKDARAYWSSLLGDDEDDEDVKEAPETPPRDAEDMLVQCSVKNRNIKEEVKEESMEEVGLAKRQAVSMGTEASPKTVKDRKRIFQLNQQFSRAIRQGKMGEAIPLLQQLLEMDQTISQETLYNMLEKVCTLPDVVMFAKAVQAAVRAGIQMDELQWATLVGILLSRDAPHAQIRVLLNIAVPTDGKIITLEPSEGNALTADELEAMFEDGDATKDKKQEKAEQDVLYLEEQGQGKRLDPSDMDVMNMDEDTLVSQQKQEDLLDPADVAKLTAKEALVQIDLPSLRGRVVSENPRASAYLCHFAILLFLERLEELRTVRSRLLRHGASNLVKFGLAFDNLEVIWQGRYFAFTKNEPLPGFPETGKMQVTFRVTTPVEWDDLRIGENECVQVAPSEKGSKGRSIAEGIIGKIDTYRNTMEVTIHGQMPEDCTQPGKRFRLDQSPIFAVFERQMTALLRLSRMRTLPPLLELLVAGETGQVDKCRSPDEPIPEDKRNSVCARLAGDDSICRDDSQLVDAVVREIKDMENLNASQKEAIRDALTKRCTIVQGPPGTGKTHVSVEILRLWAQTMHRKPILATSDSNVAVDNIAMGLMAKGVKVVRVGRLEKIRGQIEGLTLESQVQKEQDEKRKEMGHSFEDWELDPDAWSDRSAVAAKQTRQRRDDYETRMKVLKDADVICCTTISCGGEMLRQFHFHGILVDEVAQATETSTIVPLVLRGAKQLVLCGDHCQLPPNVISKEAELRGMSLSIYSRLVDCGLKPHFLNTQYRSHPKLAEFSAKTFYRNQLKTGIKAEQRPVPEGFSWPNLEVPVVFYNVQAPEEKDGESKANPAEAEKVLDVVQKLLQSGNFTVEDLGVVTPYKGQVRVLRRLLHAKIEYLREPGNDRSLECFSVDNFQGREKEIMIFSAVRCNHRHNVGFLADWRRLNVMITRARRGLVIIGDKDTLFHDPFWRQWVEWADENGCHDQTCDPHEFSGDTARGLSKLWNDSNIQNRQKQYAMLAEALKKGKVEVKAEDSGSASKKQKTGKDSWKSSWSKDSVKDWDSLEDSKAWDASNSLKDSKAWDSDSWNSWDKEKAMDSNSWNSWDNDGDWWAQDSNGRSNKGGWNTGREQYR